MATKSVGELAQSLTEQERKELLERIQRSLSLQKKDNERIYRTQLAADARLHLIEQGMQELGTWQRFLMWFRKVFRGKSEETAYLEMKLEDISRKLIAAELAEPSSRTIQAKSAELIWKLSARILTVQDFFKRVCSSEKALRDAVQFVLARKIPSAKNKLYDFMSEDDLERFYIQTENKQALRQELLNRLTSYLDGIPADVFSHLEEGILPLYYMRELAFFDFTKLYAAFKAESMTPGSNPNFKSAVADPILEELEQLYYSLYSSKKIGPNDSIHQELFEFYHELKQRGSATIRETNLPPGFIEPGNESGGEVEEAEAVEDAEEADGAGNAENSTDDVEELPPPESDVSKPADSKAAEEAIQKSVEASREAAVKLLRKNIKDVRRDIDVYLEKSMLPDLIRYFRGDPYYRFIAYVPTLNLRDFYYASTRMNLLESLDREYSGLRKRMLNKLMQRIFKGARKDFEYLKKMPMGFVKSGLPAIRYVETLTILYSYLSISFFTYTRDMLRMLLKAIPSRGREGVSSIPFHIEGLEMLFEKLRSIDTSFGPEGNDGKTLSRMRATIDRDLNQERNYRLFVAQKEKEIRTLLEEGIEHAKGLANGIAEAVKIPADAFNERFQAVSGLNASSSFHARFVDMGRELEDLHRVSRYQRLMEEEGIL